MAKRMLIDATHAEETRVVVVSGTRLEEFDVETSTKKQIKGNIYLAKVVRVEPSLQAAFVDYGGGRHGFLAFNEIHPDYFQIPVADRQALLAEQHEVIRQSSVAADFDDDAEEEAHAPAPEPMVLESAGGATARDPEQSANGESHADHAAHDHDQSSETVTGDHDHSQADDHDHQDEQAHDDHEEHEQTHENGHSEGTSEQRPRRRSLRSYKIQEVIKRRQILLVQVVKEERGNKGAALTTYLSLAGRYCVLMPNTARGGGVSRKITSVTDRKRLKTIVNELDIPTGMAVIVRTAGSERTKPEIKRDYEYLLRLWDSVRTLTLESTAPALVYEEANLIKRSIRDLYSRDIDEVHVEGEEGYRLAKDFMRMLTPSHARKVQLYRDPIMPLFHKYQVEAQLDAMHSPVVQLKSGGYLVINQTEALVAIDVNSGRSTKERHIEETALKTNIEAADEAARQLRLRDLAGLIVIDFIDMEEGRNNHTVERRLKEAMRFDRARIQLGRISPFGLLELSRQRLRPSLMETSFLPCPHCNGSGMIRSVESASMHVLRAIEEEGARRRSSEITVTVHPDVALYILNQKRVELGHIESRYGFRVYLLSDVTLVPPNLRMERIKSEVPIEIPAALPPPVEEEDSADLEEDDESEEESAEAEATEERSGEQGGEGEGGEDGRRRRRRRRRRGKRDDQGAPVAAALDGAPAAEGTEGDSEEGEAGAAEEEGEEGEASADAAGVIDGQAAPRRRRGKRGGRRRQRRAGSEEGSAEAQAEGQAPVSGEAEQAAVASEAPAAESVVSEAVAEAPAKPKRSRSRKKVEELVVDAVADIAPPMVEAALMAQAPVEEKPKKATRSRKKAAPVDVEITPEPIPAEDIVPEPVPAVAAEPAPAAAEPVASEPAGPARKGWWNRLIN
jgi:ribonuclease E